MKKILPILVVGTLLNPLNTLANEIIELEDGSHFWHTEIDYGTEIYIPTPYEYANYINHNFNNFEDLREYLCKGNNATEHATILNSYSDEEMLDFYSALNDIFEDEADVLYQEKLIQGVKK